MSPCAVICPLITRPLAPGKMICAPKVHSPKRHHLEKMGDYTAEHFLVVLLVRAQTLRALTVFLEKV